MTIPEQQLAQVDTQTGAAGGLWTHTPVDWRGNETGVKPGGWPANAATAVPPNGTVPVGPKISGISATGITATGATINWTLDIAATATQTEWGTTLAYGTKSPASPLSGSGAKSTPLSSLTTATVYHYRIIATANGLTTQSPDFTFTTS